MLPVILVLNPGSTTSKIAVFKGTRLVSQWTHSHLEESADLSPPFDKLAAERETGILADLREKGLDFDRIGIIVARGGLLKPLRGGVYRVNEKMVRDLTECTYGRHQSNLGAIMAWKMAVLKGIKCYIVNPVVVDELAPVARISGHPGVVRRSIFHALNQKAVAARVARKLGKPYTSSRLIVVHAGGGVSVGAHLNGRVVDVNNALEGEGAFSPERTGGLPLLDFLRYVNERGMDYQAVQAMVCRSGGLAAYLGTKDCREIERRVGLGDMQAKLIYRALVYQVARDIGALAAAVFKGRLDAIALTGGLAGGKLFRSWLRERVRFLAPVFVIPETSEMEALAAGAWDVWTGKVRPRVYH